MIELVNSVADLTSLRDREELELIVVRVVADLLGAVKVRLWRLPRHEGQLRLHERATLVDRIATIFEAPSDMNDLPMLDSSRELRACYDQKSAMRAHSGAKGRRRHLFPVMGSKGVDSLLDVQLAAPLRSDQQELMLGLLRIYQNHLKILDYCEKDELTGLLNRKTFEASFAHLMRIEAPNLRGLAQFERIDRRRPVDPLQPRWLAVMDVDYFKRVNDRFGHACGDDVLTLLARLMRESFRESDWLFRSGGEEFVVLLESTDGQYVRGILERFRSAVEAYRFPQVGSVTVSVGFTRVRASDDGASAFRRADEALYAAKRRGRNQMISDEEAAGSGLFSSEPLARDFVRLH
jgi:diguanylate cyclase (GGDEF)-like protein